MLEYGAQINVPTYRMEYPQLFCLAEWDEDCMVAEYFMKLSLLGYRVDENIWPDLTSYTDHPQVARIYDDDVAVKENYKQELGDLETITVCSYPRRSLLDFLYMKKQELVFFAHNKVLAVMFKDCEEDFSKIYKFYGFILNKIYREMVKKRDLVDSALLSFNDITGTHIPEIISLQIFSLQNYDLSNISG